MQELVQLSQEELVIKLTSTRQQLYHVREEVLRGKEKNHRLVKGLRADVARIATALQQAKAK